MPSARAADDAQTVAELVDRLMVMARRRDRRRAHHVGDERVAASSVTSCCTGAAGDSGRTVRRDARVVGDVLVQRAAPGDVQDLDPATDRERRAPNARSRPRRARTRSRRRRRRRRSVLGCGALAVAGGIDIGSAGEHERVDACEERLRVARVVHDHRLTAGAQHRVDVAVGERGRAGVRPLVGAAEAAPGNGDNHPPWDHHWSKFRRRSQSVTARLKWAHSWRAVFNRWSCTSVPNASAATFEPANASIASTRLVGNPGRASASAYALPLKRGPGIDAVLDAVQAGRDRRREREVGVGVGAGDPRLQAERRAVADDPVSARAVVDAPRQRGRCPRLGLITLVRVDRRRVHPRELAPARDLAAEPAAHRGGEMIGRVRVPHRARRRRRATRGSSARGTTSRPRRRSTSP